MRGHITDPTGALIPGAKITVTTTQGKLAGSATADAAGGYAVRGLAPGSYVVQAEFSGFATFVSAPVAIEAGQAKEFDVKMTIESAQQQVEVSAEGGPEVNTEAGGNANSVVLKGKDLDALSDDPDELSNELSALAGPSAGPNGGQIYIDGFTGGQLPPKSAIREIRINQNPFSAQFDRLGYGRIEILTKPGTDSLHGRFFGMGNDDAFNTGNPFTRQIPSYHSIQTNGTVSGPISKWASYFVSFQDRATQDASIYDAATALQDPTSKLWYIPTDANGNIIPVSGGLFAPQNLITFAPRFDLQLGQNNTLTVRYQFWRNHQTGNIGSTALPTQNSTSQVIENTLQLDNSTIITNNIVNDFRFEYRLGSNYQTPVSTAPTVSIPGYFSGGGNAAQSSNGHTDHYELQEFVTMTAGAHALKFGTWMRDNSQATSTSANFNGTFNFPSLQAYVDTLNGLEQGQTVAQIQQNCPASQQTQGGCTPNKLSYTTGPFGFKGNLFDQAWFFQDDWKVNRFLTLSGGLRWESQNHVADHSDWAPRFAFAYAVDGHKTGKSKTVLRGGFGFFYDRFQIQSLMNLEQYNFFSARSQVQSVISNPTCFDATSLSNALAQGCSSGNNIATPPQTYAVTPSYRSPYAEQAGFGVERQLTKSSTLSFTYLHSFGVHQMVLRNANPYAPLPGTTFYNSTTGPRILSGAGIDGIVDQYYPQAVYKQNQVILSINAQFTRSFSMSGFYNWTDANSDGGNGSNPSNSYNLMQDYGTAFFVRPQTVFVMGSYNGPWGLTFNPFLFAESGRPYSITLAQDFTGDNFFNDRPAYANSSQCAPSNSPSSTATTSLGCFSTALDAASSIVPADMLSGPASVAFNLRLSRAFGIGPSVEKSGGPPMMGGGPRGGRGRFGGFGGPGGGGPFRGGMSGTGRKYSLTFSIQALNLFNNINYGTPSGTLIPTFDPNTGVTGPGTRFGESTKLAGGMFASPSGSAARRIFGQLFFNF
ncbi:MAG: carboxypeptidase regulatory-like domain-containing protein [Acidobacteriota bacterium]